LLRYLSERYRQSELYTEPGPNAPPSSEVDTAVGAGSVDAPAVTRSDDGGAGEPT
jgi:hypothetical protein